MCYNVLFFAGFFFQKSLPTWLILQYGGALRVSFLSSCFVESSELCFLVSSRHKRRRRETGNGMIVIASG